MFCLNRLLYLYLYDVIYLYEILLSFFSIIFPQGGGGGGHQNYSSSPATSFNLASPPSLPTTINPSPVLPHPSPGGSGLLANSPSNPLHVPSPMPISSPGPAAVPLGHSPATSLIGHSGKVNNFFKKSILFFAGKF